MSKGKFGNFLFNKSNKRFEKTLYLDDIWRIANVKETHKLRLFGINFKSEWEHKHQILPDAIKTTPHKDDCDREYPTIVKVEGFDTSSNNK